MPKAQELQIKYKINYAADIVLVTGDRNWDDKKTIYKWLDKFKSIKLIVEGNCSGADLMSEEWADSREIPYLGVPARWTKEGKAAGPIRNAKMLAWLDILLGHPMPEDRTSFKVQVLAFHKNIADSKGTKDMMTKADKAGYDIYLVE